MANHLAIDYIEQDRGFATPCWIWQGAANNKGYGLVNRNKRLKLAHVLYYEKFKGLVPKDKELDHLCRVNLCINPDHLEAVTHTENMRRSKNTKLSIEIAREIRAAYASAPRKWGMQSILGRKYNAPSQNVRAILLNKIWREEA
jgi:hypothetical protein